MPTPLGRKERQGLIRRFVSGLSFPKLFFLLSGLFILDFFLIDPLPYIDEAILAILAVLVGSWREKRKQKRDSLDDVAGESAHERRLS